MQHFQELTLDIFETNTYRSVEAKEGDGASRFLKITMTRNGEPFKPEDGSTVSFRALKEDGTSVFNPAMLNSDGTITAELTTQTLAYPGRVIADIFVQKGESNLSTLSFIILVDKAPIGKEVESTNEFLVLVEATGRAEAAAAAATKAAQEASAVRQDIIDATKGYSDLSESWAVGGTGTRDGEDTNNSKYYAETAEKIVEPVMPEYATLTDMVYPDFSKTYCIKHLYFISQGITITLEDNALIYHWHGGDTVKAYLKNKKLWYEQLNEPKHIGDFQYAPHVICNYQNDEKGVPVIPDVNGAKFMLYRYEDKVGNVPEIWTATDQGEKMTWTSPSGDTWETDNAFRLDWLEHHPNAEEYIPGEYQKE